jgi:hypothetical protein
MTSNSAIPEAASVAASLPEYRTGGIIGDTNRPATNSTSSWQERFNELKQYQQDHGNCLVPGRYKENPPLGRWVESQRKQYHQYMAAKKVGTLSGCAMTDERIALLEGIGFEWSVRKAKRSGLAVYKPGLSWEERLEQLKEFKQAYGHCSVPYQFEQDPSFGRWVANQRNARRQLESGSYSSMTNERMELLNAIGFEWTPPRVRKSTGDAKVAWDEPIDGKPAPTPLDAAATAQAPTAATKHDGGYFEETNESDASAESNKNVPAPQPPTTDNNALTEESQSKKSERAPIKKRAPREKKTPRGDFGDKDHKRKVWNERFDELKAYKEQHGNCNVPGRCKTHPQLGRWVETQRKQYHRYMQAKEQGKTQSYNFAIGMDEEDRISKLNEIGFEWSVRGSKQTTRKDRPKLSWDQRMVQLKAYKEGYGNCLVPHKYAPCPSLGIWVANQRTWKRLYDAAKADAEDVASVTNAVKEDRIRQLNDIGFEWAPERPSRKRKSESTSSSAPAPKKKKKTAAKKLEKSFEKGSKKSGASATEPQEEQPDVADAAILAVADILEEAQSTEAAEPEQKTDEKEDVHVELGKEFAV